MFQFEGLTHMYVYEDFHKYTNREKEIEELKCCLVDCIFYPDYNFSPNLHQATVFARQTIIEEKGVCQKIAPRHIKWRWVVQGPCYWLLLTAVKWALTCEETVKQAAPPAVPTMLLHFSYTYYGTGADWLIYTRVKSRVLKYLQFSHYTVHFYSTWSYPQFNKIAKLYFWYCVFFFLAFITGKLLQMMQIFHWILTLGHPDSSS